MKTIWKTILIMLIFMALMAWNFESYGSSSMEEYKACSRKVMKTTNGSHPRKRNGLIQSRCMPRSKMRQLKYPICRMIVNKNISDFEKITKKRKSKSDKEQAIKMYCGTSKKKR